MKLRTLIAAAALVASPAIFTTTAAAETAVAPIFTAEDNNLAVSGYDTVSYFSGAPVKGSADFATTYEGATFQFASQENLDTFLADPAKYAPAYGGYCAWAIGANDALAPGDPNVYKIVDGTLYLNITETVVGFWEEDIPGNLELSESNWVDIEAKPASTNTIPKFTSAAPQS